ncbi:MAG TPA: fenitrothion hydrolase [Solirubrobacteraceae bacterium]|nr:fenitrothion hydrolase [Solirubrobacteraceae bacterium]
MFVIAHGIVGRADLPIPETMFGVAAAAVLVLSFAALATLWSRPRLQDYAERRLFRLPAGVDVALGTLGVLVFLVTAYAGLAGTDAQRDNLAPTMVYVAFWVGVPFVALLFGDVWRLVSPWRAIGRGTGWIMQRIGGEMPEPMRYPARLGRWPAVVGLFGFGVCELCWGAARDPLPLAVLMLAYTVVMLVGMSLYGVEVWSRNGDAFGLYFGLFASLSCFTRRDGALYARPPVVGAGRLDPLRGTTALLVVAIGVTAFDGAAEGPVFNDRLPGFQDFFAGLGFSQGTALELGFLVGLLAVIGLIGLIWTAGVAGMPGRPGPQLVHSLIPIVAAYVVAHYFSLLAYNGQDVLRLLSDPLGEGSDLFGTAQNTIDYGVVSATAIWYVQVVALVLGHVAALVLAHDRALVIYGSHRDATRSQVVMLVVMVCFTCLGLYLLSAANG